MQTFKRLLGCAVLCAGAAQAETVYVTDRLQLGLYDKENASGQQLQTLISGTALQLLERNQYYAKVRAPDGTVGWAKAAYLVTEKPPRLVLQELEAERSKLGQELKLAQAELTKTKSRLEELTGQATRAVASAEQSRDTLAQLIEENRGLRASADAHKMSVPFNWFLASVGSVLILGFLGGLYWLDSRIRKRHGGFRIY